MPKSLPDIIYNKENDIPVIDATSSFYTLPMYKDSNFFSNFDSYVQFVKGCEKIVRQDRRYKSYISFLKKEVKLDRCQVLSDVTDKDAQIEMHHGPIFNLFDYCAIILEYFLINKLKISTLRIADQCLEEHYKHRIQVVMVSQTIHEEIHNGDLFINQKQAFGNINDFIDKYWKAINEEYRNQINNYIDRSLMYDSTDFGVLELNKNIIR